MSIQKLGNEKPSLRRSSKAINFLFCCLAGVSLFIGAFTPAFIKVLYSPSVILQASRDQNLIGNAPQIASKWILAHRESIQNDLILVGINNLTEDNLTKIISTLFPEEMIGQILNDLSVQYQELISKKTDLLLISLVPVKQELTGNQGIPLFNGLLSLYPPCRPTEIATWLQLGIDNNLNLPALCYPGAIAMQLIAPLIQPLLDNEITQLPSEIPLLDMSKEVKANSRLSQFVLFLRSWQTPMVVFPFVAFFLLLIVLIKNRKNILDGMRFCGLTILISGLMAIVAESILIVLLNSRFDLKSLSNLVGFSFSGPGAEIFLRMSKLVGNAFFFYVGIVSFGLMQMVARGIKTR